MDVAERGTLAGANEGQRDTGPCRLKEGHAPARRREPRNPGRANRFIAMPVGFGTTL